MNLSLIVGSCDKYDFIWSKFFHLFNRYWDHSIDIPKYFVTETKPAINKNFIPITTFSETWNHKVKYCLQHVKTDYVLWIQDDYFLRRTINKNQFTQYLNFIQSNNVQRFGIHDDSELYWHNKDSESKYYRFSQHSLYTISMQASIWQKAFFNSCLDYDPETIWQFEVDGTQRLNKSSEHIIYFDKQQPSWYKEGLKQGNYTNDYFNICKEENL